MNFNEQLCKLETHWGSLLLVVSKSEGSCEEDAFPDGSL